MYVHKDSPNIWATAVTIKPPKVNNRPIGEKSPKLATLPLIEA
jgi:hypothetical protein